MPIFRKAICFILLVLCLSSCRYGDIMESAVKAKLADKNSNPVFDGEVEPPFPDKSDNDKTIMGIDTNKNGIRDDIDIWINRNAINSNDRRSLRQLAKAMGEKLQSLSELSAADLEKYRFIPHPNVNKKENNEIRSTRCYNVISASLRNHLPLKVRSRFENNPFLILLWLINDSSRERTDASNRLGYITVITKTDEFDPRKPWAYCNFEVENKEEVIKLFKQNKAK